MDLSKAVIVPITEKLVREKMAWRYDGIYAFYNRTDEGPYDGDDFEIVADEQEYACIDENGKMIGTFCYGSSARIPTIEEGAYDEDRLDIGLGMRPDLCGRGYGAEYVGLGIRFAQEQFGRSDLRLSVAAFNERAIRVYEKVGFHETAEVTNAYFKNKFKIMVPK